MSPLELNLLEGVATAIGLIYASYRASIRGENVALMIMAGLIGGWLAEHARLFPLGFLLGYCLAGGSAFRKELSSRTDESTLLVLTINFLYLITTFKQQTRTWILPLVAGPALVTLYSAFTMKSLSARMRLVLSLWYIAITTTLAARFGTWYFLGLSDSGSERDILSVLTLGLFSASVLGTGAAFFGLLNFTEGLHLQDKKKRERWWKRVLSKELPMFAEQISPEELPPRFAALIAGLQTLLFILNETFGLVPPPVALSFSVSVFPAIIEKIISRSKLP